MKTHKVSKKNLKLEYECSMCSLYYKELYNQHNMAEIITINSQPFIKKPDIKGSEPSHQEVQQAIITLAKNGFYMANACSRNFIKLTSGDLIPTDFSEILHEKTNAKEIPAPIREKMLIDHKSIRGSLPKEVQMEYICAFTHIDIQAKTQRIKQRVPHLFNVNDEANQQADETEALTLN
ncbi:MAG: hypothetical protein EP298_06860 [Gammaproteobacteria bacterium]|nr:MAG: hypothetical protein EP298_06860 [Gammaproteobacteria bacterium]UTW42953.1 hypothetical protein KFE69_02095 [bacterium SCSIO 12844]